MRNKKNLIYLFVLIILSLGAYFVYKKKATSGTIDEKFKAFNVEDTAQVSQLFIAKMNGEKVNLVRKNGKDWSLNDKYLARPDAIENILEVLKTMKVRRPVPKGSRATIIKNIASSGIKLEVYQNNTLHKTIYIGHDTQDHYATFMLLEVDGEKSPIPFEVHIPGFRGGLSVRFFTSEPIWRKQTVFNYHYSDIHKIQFKAKEFPSESFEVIHFPNDTFELISLENGRKYKVNIQEAQQYFLKFKELNYEYIVEEVKAGAVDSLNALEPYYECIVTDFKGNTTDVKTYLIKNPEGTLSLDGLPMEYDVDRMFALMNDDGDLYSIQFLSFDRIVRKLSDLSR